MINVENSFAGQSFCGIHLYLKKNKQTFFCNILNMFTVTLDQLNVSMLNTNINLFFFIIAPNI